MTNVFAGGGVRACQGDCTPTARLPPQVGATCNVMNRHQFNGFGGQGIPRCRSRITTAVCFASPPAAANNSTARPTPPQSVSELYPAGVAAATNLLTAIPRAATVRELQDIMQQAQAHGCLTTAHSVAALLQLGNLAAGRFLPGDAEAARRLGDDLFGRLRGNPAGLSPSLTALTEKAATRLGLQPELGLRPGPRSGAPGGSPSRHGAGEGPPAVPGDNVGSSGLRAGGVADVRPVAASAAQAPRGRKQRQQPQLQQQQQQLQQQQQPQLQAAVEKRQPKRPQQPRGQPRAGHVPPAGRSAHLEPVADQATGALLGLPQAATPVPGTAPAASTPTARAHNPPASPGPPNSLPPGASPGPPNSLPAQESTATAFAATVAPLPSPAAAPPPSPAATTSVPPNLIRTPPEVPAPPKYDPASTPLTASAVATSHPPGPASPLEGQASGPSPAVAADPAAAAAAAVSQPPLSEALRLGWKALGRRQRQPHFLLSITDADARDPGPDVALLEAALQQQPPADMALGDVAEVLQLLLELRLVPRYEWLLGARDRVRGAMAELEAEAVRGDGHVGAMGPAEAASRVADLQVVYDVTGELTAMCWEADGQKREGADEGGAGTGQLQPALPPPSQQQQQQRMQQQLLVEDVSAVAPAAAPAAGTGPEVSAIGGSSGAEVASGRDMPLAGAQAAPVEVAAGPLRGIDLLGPSLPSSLASSRDPTVTVGPGEEAMAPLSSQPLREAASGQDEEQGEAQPKHGQVLREQQLLQDQEQNRHQLQVAEAVQGQQAAQRQMPHNAAIMMTEPDAAPGPISPQQQQPLQQGGGQEEEQPEEEEQQGHCSALQRLREQLLLARGLNDRSTPVPHTVAPTAVGSHHAGPAAVGPAPPEATVRQAVSELSALLTEALHADAVGRSSGSTAAGGGVGVDGTGVGVCPGPGPSPSATPPHPALTAARLASMVTAASCLQPRLPSQLLTAAVRLLAGGGVRGGVAPEDVVAVAAACAAAGFVPPGQLLEQLALLAFGAANHPPSASPANPPQPVPSGVPAAAPVAAAAVATDVGSSDDGDGSAATSARSLHSCAIALGRLGCRLNNKQFSAWIEAAVRSPRALSPAQLAQLLAACMQRGFLLRSAGAGALVEAAVSPAGRLEQLSASEAATLALFAVQQGLRLDSTAEPPLLPPDGASAGERLLRHLAPRLRELPPGELAALLPALYSTGALRPGGRGAVVAAAPAAADAASAWLDAHSAALLPQAEALLLDELPPLLQVYDELSYRPPPLLLLGFSLCLESHLGSGRPLAVLGALHALLCRLGFPPNGDLAAAIREDFVPRLMVAATASAAAASPAGAPPSGLTMAQRLTALDVFAAARVRPYPAQIAVLLEPELAGEGALGSLPGDDLARLLWHCATFRALPSWRFLGEWLEACAVAMHAGEGATGGGGSGAGRGLKGRMSAGALARVGWCLAQMGVQPEPAWQGGYHAAVLEAMPRLDAEALSLAAHSALALRTRPGEEWMEGLIRAALGRMERVDAASAARLLHFAAAAELKVSKDWMQSFFLHTLRYLRVPEAEPPRYMQGPGPGPASASPDQVALMLRALAQLGFRPPSPWLASSLEVLRRGAASLSPACFPVVLTSLARVCPDVASDLGPGSALEALMRAAHDRRERFTAVELAWLLDTLGCHYPAYRLPAAAEANLIEALRRRKAVEAAGEGGDDGGSGAQSDVVAALGDAVSSVWLAWGSAAGEE